MVSRWAHNSKVGGSKPLSATFLFYFSEFLFLYKRIKHPYYGIFHASVKISFNLFVIGINIE